MHGQQNIKIRDKLLKELLFNHFRIVVNISFTHTYIYIYIQRRDTKEFNETEGPLCPYETLFVAGL